MAQLRALPVRKVMMGKVSSLEMGKNATILRHGNVGFYTLHANRRMHHFMYYMAILRRFPGPQSAHDSFPPQTCRCTPWGIMHSRGYSSPFISTQKQWKSKAYIRGGALHASGGAWVGTCLQKRESSALQTAFADGNHPF